MRYLEEYNEFTWDMVRTLPRVYYCNTNNIPVTVSCKPGLKSIYGLFTDNVIEKNIFNEYNDSSTYSNLRPAFTLNEWTPPPLKNMWGGFVKFAKPTVVIQNKYSMEWEQGIFNYFPIEILDEIFTIFRDKYQIVYIRPDGNGKNYFNDKNRIEPFGDYEFIYSKFQDVLTIKDLMKHNPTIDYNIIQYMVHATSDIHISTSGGNACVSSYFGGDVFIYDSPLGLGANRGIWKTDSWLQLLGNSKIHGYNDYTELLNKLKKQYNE